MKRKTMTFPDVGINSLEDLTKDELIECFRYLQNMGASDAFWLNHALISIADKRRKKQLEDSDDKFNLWVRLMDEYNKLLAPYEGMKIGELPADVIQKGAELERRIRKAKEAYLATF